MTKPVKPRGKPAGSKRDADLQAECDFSRVPDPELAGCVLYEYARESERVRQMVKEARKPPRPDCGRFLLLVALCCKGFPRAPWQKLSHEERRILAGEGDELRRRLEIEPGPAGFPALLLLDEKPRKPFVFDPKQWEAVAPQPTALKPPRERRVVTQRAWLSLGQWRASLDIPESSEERCGFYYVHLGYTEGWLVKEFRAWLRKQEPAPRQQAPPKRGRRGGGGFGQGFWKAAANQLGALRQRFYFDTLARAKERFGTYSSRKDYNAAIAKAVENFRYFLGSPKNEFPIHHTRAWRGKKRP